jgi:hypothetical protein
MPSTHRELIGEMKTEHQSDNRVIEVSRYNLTKCLQGTLEMALLVIFFSSFIFLSFPVFFLFFIKHFTSLLQILRTAHVEP